MEDGSIPYLTDHWRVLFVAANTVQEARLLAEASQGDNTASPGTYFVTNIGTADPNIQAPQVL